MKYNMHECLARMLSSDVRWMIAFFSVHFALHLYLPRACSMWLHYIMTDKLSPIELPCFLHSWGVLPFTLNQHGSMCTCKTNSYFILQFCPDFIWHAHAQYTETMVHCYTMRRHNSSFLWQHNVMRLHTDYRNVNKLWKTLRWMLLWDFSVFPPCTAGRNAVYLLCYVIE